MALPAWHMVQGKLPFFTNQRFIEKMIYRIGGDRWVDLQSSTWLTRTLNHGTNDQLKKKEPA